MYIRRKVYSVAYDEYTGEEKLFCTTELIDENEYIERLYAEAEAEDEKTSHGRVKGAAIGTGAVLGTGTAIGGAGYVSGKYAGKAGEKLEILRGRKYARARQAADESLENFKSKFSTAHKESEVRKAEEQMDKAYKKLNKLSKEGRIEKGLKSLSKGGKAATEWVKNNPKLAAGIAAGTVVSGGAAGALARGNKD